MKTRADLDAEAALWGRYPGCDDIARFEYGRRMWRRPAMRARLLAHWSDARHPHRERFAERRAQIEAVLASDATPAELDAALRAQDTSLRCAAREIPPVFGSFFGSAASRRVTSSATASFRRKSRRPQRAPASARSAGCGGR